MCRRRLRTANTLDIGHWSLVTVHSCTWWSSCGGMLWCFSLISALGRLAFNIGILDSATLFPLPFLPYHLQHLPSYLRSRLPFSVSSKAVSGPQSPSRKTFLCNFPPENSYVGSNSYTRTTGKNTRTTGNLYQ